MRRNISEAKKGGTLSEEHKQNLSIALSGENCYWWGKKLSEEHIQHLSESHIGQVAWNKGLTKETSEGVKKISESKKGKSTGVGRKDSEEAKRNKSIAATGRILSQELIMKRTATRKCNSKLKRWDKIISDLVNTAVIQGGYNGTD